MNSAIDLWFILTGLSVAYVVWDIPKTPEAVVLKWAFVILTVFTGPFGAFFYVLGCREPLENTHAAYVAAPWRQVLGSTMHCAAGDGIGIIAGVVIASVVELSAWGDFGLEYLLGFGFGWAFFQAFAMRDMYDGSYGRSLRATFLPELLSMNLLMAGMIVTMKRLMGLIEGADNPLDLAFWFTMSMALIVGFALAYPVNWWLVVNKLKHGMMTVPPEKAEAAAEPGGAAGHGAHTAPKAAAPEAAHADHGAAQTPSPGQIAAMTLATFAALGLGLWLAGGFF